MKYTVRWLLLLLVFCVAFAPGNAQPQTQAGTEDHFPLLPGLESAVEFWKKIFTEYSMSQLVFFDPLDMSRIYDVLDIGEESRTSEYIDGERERMAAAHGVDLERVRAQSGIKDGTAAGLKRSGRHDTHAADLQRARPAD